MSFMRRIHDAGATCAARPGNSGRTIAIVIDTRFTLLISPWAPRPSLPVTPGM